MVTKMDSEKDTDKYAGTDMDMESGTFAKYFIWRNSLYSAARITYHIFRIFKNGAVY
jgi:hypothetical protein